jgi:hypothetical protein
MQNLEVMPRTPSRPSRACLAVYVTAAACRKLLCWQEHGHRLYHGGIAWEASEVLRRRFARFAVAKGRRGICSVCTHAQRREIELATVTLVPVSAIAVRYDISTDSVYRHAKKHFTPPQRAAYLSAMKPAGVDLEQLQRSEGESLLA